MNIGIIGAGHIGKLLVRKLSAAGHAVKVANSRGPGSIDAETLETGAFPVTVEEAAKDVDTLILSVPLGKLPAVAPRLASLPADIIVIDTSNYYPQRDGEQEGIESGQVESLWVAELLGRPIIKAWNAIGSDSLATKGAPAGTPGRIAIPVAGDNEVARKVAMGLVEATGFDALDAGCLTESWRQQPGAPCYCTDLTKAKLRAALATAERGRLTARRDIALAAIMERMGGELGPNPDAEFGVRISRALFR